MNARIPMALILMLLLSYIPAYGQADATTVLDEPRLFKKLNQLNSQQMIVVTADQQSSITGKLSLYTKQNGTWKRQLGPIPVVFGNKGLGKTKEGDGKTPLGTYTLGTAFGSSKQAPAGLKVDYRAAGIHDYWVDAPNSPDYNSWVSYEGDPKERWSSFERLHHPLYQQALVINYNTNPVVAGKGSAIFMHIWRGSNKPTEGCIAMSREHLSQLLTMIDPDLSPKVRIGVGTGIY